MKYRDYPLSEALKNVPGYIRAMHGSAIFALLSGVPIYSARVEKQYITHLQLLARFSRRYKVCVCDIDVAVNALRKRYTLNRWFDDFILNMSRNELGIITIDRDTKLPSGTRDLNQYERVRRAAAARITFMDKNKRNTRRPLSGLALTLAALTVEAKEIARGIN